MGRPRARLDAIFHAAVTGDPWRLLPERFGKPFTVARHFRRLSHAGLWQRLMYALCHPRRRPPSAPWNTGSAAPPAGRCACCR
jgi:transposase